MDDAPFAIVAFTGLPVHPLVCPRIAFDNTGEKLIVMWALVGGGSDLYLLDVPDLAVARCVHVARPNKLGTLPAIQGSFGVGGKWLSYRSRLVAPLSNPFPRTW